MRTLRLEIIACLFLVAITLVALGQSCGNGFVNYDDPVYVTSNRHLKEGLSWAGLRWAWTDFRHCMWNPMTRMSFLLDYELAGLNPWWYHLHNLLLHLGCVLLLYGLLRRLTGSSWRSLVVAGFFAVHPMHVESVAWVTERKDVLSTLFGLLCIGMYARYSERPGVIRFLIVLLTYSLSLLAKPMLVTLPCVLLLLDYWPLRRLQLGTGAAPDGPAEPNVASAPSWKWLVVEKLPILFLAILFSVVTTVTHREISPMRDRLDLPLIFRLACIVLAYVQYLVLTFLPAGLAILYPYPDAISPSQVAGSALLLIGISFVAVQQLRGRPYLLVGWLWFLGTMVPVSGLLPNTHCFYADRYSYVPHIGLFIMLTWGLADLVSRHRAARVAAAPLLGLALAVCMVCTTQQAACWKDARSLWGSALARTKNNCVAHVNYGAAIMKEPSMAEVALGHFNEAIRINPKSRTAHLNMAIGYSVQGNPREAEKCYRRLIEIDPNYSFAHGNLGMVLLHLGKLPKADEHLARALELNPDFLDAQVLRGVVLDRLGKPDLADEHFAKALELAPNNPLVHSNWGVALLRRGKPLEAKPRFEDAARLDHTDVDAHLNLGMILLGEGNAEAAKHRLRKALEYQPKYGEAHYNLGVILEREGNLEQAEHHLREACRLIPDFAEANDNLGVVLELRGNLAEARTCYQQALLLTPDLVDARCNLAGVLYDLGQIDGAMAQYREAARLDRRWPVLANDAAWKLLHDPDPRQRNAPEALRIARQASQATGQQRPEMLRTVAACYAALGRFPEAAQTARQALTLISVEVPPGLREAIQQELQSYEARAARPVRAPGAVVSGVPVGTSPIVQTGGVLEPSPRP